MLIFCLKLDPKNFVTFLVVWFNCASILECNMYLETDDLVILCRYLKES